ncbi:4Fe-4S dicluster domain-containing protein, partial [Candidatus Bathyarchaeota archaeon]|nr:4Fe-4S dicluster domain-containing protein [Candidatus Bathyarchaeota archaeon]
FCTDPPCVEVCPQKCMERDEKTGVIHVDEDKCDGCSFCIKACPFGAIALHTESQKAIMCDLCESTDAGEPQCVIYCPKEAIQVKSVTGLAQESRKTQVLALLKGLEKEV